MADVPHQQSNIMGSTTAGPPSLGHGNHTFRGRVLVIAGSDPSGGAGLEADQKAIAAHGGYAMTATTALTVQNTVGVARVELIDWTFTRDQIEAVFEDIGVDAVKTGRPVNHVCIGDRRLTYAWLGMMSSLESVAGIVEVLRSRKMAQNLPFLVVDPVGHRPPDSGNWSGAFSESFRIHESLITMPVLVM